MAAKPAWIAGTASVGSRQHARMRSTDPLRYFSVGLIVLGMLISFISFHALIHVSLFAVSAIMVFSGIFLFILAVAFYDNG